MEAFEPFRFSVAPMMEWTDRHCRYFHRQLSRRTLLYTEMFSSKAIVHGNAERLLAFSPEEHPVAAQLGGAEPGELAEAARIASEAGYDEINLNAGCPSERVKDGCFGAVLMLDPMRTAECARAMIEGASGTEVTVKCRIGVDGQEPGEALPAFIEAVKSAGVRRVAIHARKAWLSGLSPKQNRTVPPLDYPLVARMKAEFPGLVVCVNGGIESLDQAERFLRSGLDGVMVGRSAYKSPAELLLDVDRRMFGEPCRATRESAAKAMIPYIESHIAEGGKAHQVTRHMLGLFAGMRGARKWRAALSDARALSTQGASAVVEALRAIAESALEPA